ncbi:hypothetical protein BN946_scf184962.g89, partial [Trametes cinnabarina]
MVFESKMGMPLTSNSCSDYIVLTTEALFFRLEDTEFSVNNAPWTPGDIVVSELGHATCPGLPAPVLSTIIDDWKLYSCDEAELCVVLKSRGNPHGFPRIALKFRDELDYFEMARVVHEAKSHLAVQRDSHRDSLAALHRGHFAPLHAFHERTPASGASGRTVGDDAITFATNGGSLEQDMANPVDAAAADDRVDINVPIVPAVVGTNDPPEDLLAARADPDAMPVAIVTRTFTPVKKSSRCTRNGLMSLEVHVSTTLVGLGHCARSQLLPKVHAATRAAREHPAPFALTAFGAPLDLFDIRISGICAVHDTAFDAGGPDDDDVNFGETRITVNRVLGLNFLLAIDLATGQDFCTGLVPDIPWQRRNNNVLLCRNSVFGITVVMKFHNQEDLRAFYRLCRLRQ